MTKSFVSVIVMVLVLLAVLIVFISAYTKIQSARCNKTEYSSEASLSKVLDREELHMTRYPYNGIAKKVVTEKTWFGKIKEKVLYNVRYKGTATLGTKEKIGFDVYADTKTIVVHIPEPEVLDYNIDFSSIDYIFEKGKYETETISEDSYKLCLEDMSEKVKCDEELKKKAKENTGNMILGLLQPMHPEYKIEYD